jgi:hypothetical protein
MHGTCVVLCDFYQVEGVELIVPCGVPSTVLFDPPAIAGALEVWGCLVTGLLGQCHYDTPTIRRTHNETSVLLNFPPSLPLSPTF